MCPPISSARRTNSRVSQKKKKKPKPISADPEQHQKEKYRKTYQKSAAFPALTYMLLNVVAAAFPILLYVSHIYTF